ncbi:hypothetical protein FA13DRAFT_1715959 [Coprinellus micaceus]|uniref:Uncharacterized protein n=1 Tax=Coprinellus micaceus TaxID=71717 RepID=A0A4Y7SMT0_COPMI|nr:hypothetical protein FA13DRAFT_1715959 [Coprinellus micaceus]
MPNVRLSDGIMLNRDECFISICHGRVTRHARYIVTTEPEACWISGHSESCGGVNFAVWGKVPKLGVSREVPPLSKRGELGSWLGMLCQVQYPAHVVPVVLMTTSISANEESVHPRRPFAADHPLCIRIAVLQEGKQ